MPAGRAVIDSKLAKGQSLDCARSHHPRCTNPAECTCDCHHNPQRLEARQDAARRAHITRGHSTSSPTSEAPPTRAPKETAPKRPDVKSGHKPVIPAAAAKQLKSEFALLVWGADGIVAGARPELWKTPEDRLTEGEISALTGAIYNELEARAPGLLKILAKAQESAPEAALIYTLAMIAIPRLARREATVLGVKVTPEFARAVVLAPLVFAQQAAAQSSAGVESVPTSQPDRPNGYGQIDPRGAPVEGPPVQVGATQQAGFSDIRHGPGDTNGAWANGHAP
jgi:hypothetical protein